MLVFVTTVLPNYTTSDVRGVGNAGLTETGAKLVLVTTILPKDVTSGTRGAASGPAGTERRVRRW